jgi:hypothetical protein
MAEASGTTRRNNTRASVPVRASVRGWNTGMAVPHERQRPPQQQEGQHRHVVAPPQRRLARGARRRRQERAVLRQPLDAHREERADHHAVHHRERREQPPDRLGHVGPWPSASRTMSTSSAVQSWIGSARSSSARVVATGTGARRQPASAGWGGERRRVVHGGADATRGEVPLERGPVGRADHVLVHGAPGRAGQWAEALRQAGVVAAGQLAAARQPGLQPFGVAQQHGGLHGVEPRGSPRVRHHPLEHPPETAARGCRAPGRARPARRRR